MYKIYADDTLFYDDTTSELETLKLINPKLTMEDNAAGSFTATIPSGNVMYSRLQPMLSTITVYREDEWVWTGRVLKISKDFWKQETIECEGALAFLNDSVHPLKKYSSTSLSNYVNYILTAHNDKVPENRKIYRGTIATKSSDGTTIPNTTYYVDGENSLSILRSVQEDWGFHFRIRYSSSKLYLDIIRDSDLPNTDQEIQFNKNLLDYSDGFDGSNIVTVLLPVGKTLDTYYITGETDGDHPDHIYINSYKDSSGAWRQRSNVSPYVSNTQGVSTYGKIERTITWSEIEDPTTLKNLATLYLTDFQYNELELTIKVMDFSYVDSDTPPFKFLTKVRCISPPHGLDKTFFISKMEIPFDQPQNTTFTFSSQELAGLYGSDRNVVQATSRGTISSASSHSIK